MRNKFPRLETILAFLNAKGWKESRRTLHYIVLDPPTWMKFDRPVNYYIPISEELEDYAKYIPFKVKSICELYDLDYEKMLHFFSHSLEELKEEEALRKEILSKAA